jgi:Ca2+-binding RTX toxin-like protein
MRFRRTEFWRRTGNDTLAGGSGDDGLWGDNFVMPGPSGTTIEFASSNSGNDVLLTWRKKGMAA